ncbi:pentraxin fusion protein-like [Engystomops pustulosus]|uniref:pentraxin fusion protein-like n=1 Tax=Engystomops pustulosus TaxID=76066 RepID=UPI003AFB4980
MIDPTGLVQILLLEQVVHKIPPGNINLARTGIATQDSDYTASAVPSEARLAIDGNRNSDFNQKSCSHTGGNEPAWWRLELKKKSKISVVVIAIRSDCCMDRFKGAELRIGNSQDATVNPICGKVSAVKGSNYLFCCDGMEGKYISVVIPDRHEFLSLCEVEVYAKPIEGTHCK